MRRDDTPSVERQILSTRRWLQTHRWLRLHVGLIALCCLGCLWLSGALLRAAGVDALSLRFGLSLVISYGVYLGLLRLWAAYLLSREDADLGDAAEIGFDAADAGARLGGRALRSLDLPDLDEGALVLLPIAALIAMALMLAALLGTGVTLLFGVEVLMAVSVEVALAAFAAGLAWRHQRQFERGGWLRCALRHTWTGALALLLAGVGLGAALDRWMPQAESLPHAARIWRTP
ncbi:MULTISPECIES: hypothetical protein [unclassified Roseateles]|uniref:hypothetical protein n=1 Tax=unclassified Roseateles TaxID=2626991 RepID=UPI0007147BEE|nr:MULTISPECIES: hypothetical protein [unclassified Roseateles]KQW51103.1 hypothetical protein ASC81_00090 [Pelomonas sp. Root405]KRA77335.1 hypothetical protein ASD88_00090 [Pelomonas sp. Root662]